MESAFNKEYMKLIKRDFTPSKKQLILQAKNVAKKLIHQGYRLRNNRLILQQITDNNILIFVDNEKSDQILAISNDKMESNGQTKVKVTDENNKDIEGIIFNYNFNEIKNKTKMTVEGQTDEKKKAAIANAIKQLSSENANANIKTALTAGKCFILNNKIYIYLNKDQKELYFINIDNIKQQYKDIKDEYFPLKTSYGTILKNIKIEKKQKFEVIKKDKKCAQLCKILEANKNIIFYDTNHYHCSIYLNDKTEIVPIKDTIQSARQSQQDAITHKAEDTEQLFRDGKAPDASDTTVSDANRQALMKNSAVRGAFKRLKLRDKKMQNNFLANIIAAFAAMFGTKLEEQDQYQEYSDKELMSFAPRVRRLVRRNNLRPGQYTFTLDRK